MQTRSKKPKNKKNVPEKEDELQPEGPTKKGKIDWSVDSSNALIEQYAHPATTKRVYKSHLTKWLEMSDNVPPNSANLSDAMVAKFLSNIWTGTKSLSQFKGCCSMLADYIWEAGKVPIKEENRHLWPKTFKVIHSMKHSPEYKEYTPTKAETFSAANQVQIISHYKGANAEREGLLKLIFFYLSVDCMMRISEVDALKAHMVTLEINENGEKIVKVDFQSNGAKNHPDGADKGEAKSKSRMVSAGKNFLSCCCGAKLAIDCQYHTFEKYMSSIPKPFFNPESGSTLKFLRAMDPQKEKFIRGNLGKGKLWEFITEFKEIIGAPIDANFSSHSGRRTGITTLSKAGMNPNEIQQYSHHKTVESVFGYIDTNETDLTKGSKMLVEERRKSTSQSTTFLLFWFEILFLIAISYSENEEKDKEKIESPSKIPN